MTGTAQACSVEPPRPPGPSQMLQGGPSCGEVGSVSCRPRTGWESWLLEMCYCFPISL